MGTLVVKMLSSEISPRFTLRDKTEKKEKIISLFFSKIKKFKKLLVGRKLANAHDCHSAMESYLLNSHDIPTDYRCIFSWFLHAIYRKNIIITVAYFRAKGIKILGTFPVYELNHLCVNLLLCVQFNLSPNSPCYLMENIPIIIHLFFLMFP